MSGQGLGERHLRAAERIVGGMTPLEAAKSLGISSQAMSAIVDDLQRSLGVLTLRAMSFRLLEQCLVPLPGPYAQLHLDPVTRHVWEAMRWDILDIDLVPVLIEALSLTRGTIQSVIDQLCETCATSRHGLIRAGFAHGLLSADQTVTPPHTTGVRPSRPGVGSWDPGPAQRRVLALQASGRDTATCAREERTTTSAIAWRVTRCKDMAGVRSGRALIHAALRAGVLLPPEISSSVEPAGGERAVWQSLPLDVPDHQLASAIGNSTGLSINVVHGYLRRLRIRYRTDEAAVYAGWRHRVITADTPTFPPGREPLPPALPAPAPRSDAPAAVPLMKLSPRQHEVLTLLTVDGMNLDEAAAKLGKRYATVRAHQRSCLQRAEAATLRALTHRALSLRLLDPLDAGDRDPGELPDDAETVWQHLPVDVPDHQLVEQIARMTGLSEGRVRECLNLLRATGLTDPQLIAVGWRRKLLTTRPANPAPITTPAPVPVIAPQCRPTLVHRLNGPQPDPLRLLPGPPPAFSGDAPQWGTAAVAGEELDFVRISPPTCRSFLSRIPATRWGPVLGLPEVHEVLLLTAAGPRPTRRGQAARLVRPRTTVTLPGPSVRTGPGRYWAVDPRAPLWEQKDLAWLLENSLRPMPDLSEATR
ncbi:helix-turn-helix transcriptional regulator [Streptomyces anulatus]